MNDLHLLSILLLAVSSSMDNLGTGVSYGLRNICIPLSLNLIIALFNRAGGLMEPGHYIAGRSIKRQSANTGDVILYGTDSAEDFCKTVFGDCLVKGDTHKIIFFLGTY
jgi:hypothetical protein